MNQKQVQAEAAIIDWVVARFIAEGKDSTVKEISAGTGMPESRIRRIADRPSPKWSRAIWSEHNYQTTYSKDYPGMKLGTCRVKVYGPTVTKFLAEQLKALKPMTAAADK